MNQSRVKSDPPLQTDPSRGSAGLPGRTHLPVLDGWRGISISLVLAAHLLPLGPKSWDFNWMCARLGMAIFFVLSGFLITRVLLTDASVKKFLIRRFLRILPLAWLAMAITFPLTNVASSSYLPNFFFYANLPPVRLAEVGSHFWSLCVEMQFYVAVAGIVLVCGARGLFTLPVLCVGVTALRVFDGAQVDIVTWHRVDEILAGATLGLVYSHRLGRWPQRVLAGRNFYFFLLLAVIASHRSSGFMNYLQPYIVAALVGSTIYTPTGSVKQLLSRRSLKYLATVSFALYVIHGMLVGTWLGEGGTFTKYLKRPLLFAVTFLLAHVSTFYFEVYWIGLGKRLTKPRPRSSQH